MGLGEPWLAGCSLLSISQLFLEELPASKNVSLPRKGLSTSFYFQGRRVCQESRCYLAERVFRLEADQAVTLPCCVLF